MISRSTPIVIQLKKRSGPGAQPDGANGDAPPPPEDPAPEAPENEDSGESSEGDDKAPAKPKASLKGPVVGSFSETVSLLDVVALADLFRTFHDEVDTFVRKESERLFEQEARNQQARRTFQETATQVRSFLEEFAPEGGLPESENEEDDADGSEGSEASGSDSEAERRKAKVSKKAWEKKAKESSEHDTVTKRLLPQFLRFAAADRSALQDAVDLLATFVDRHFKQHKELTPLLENPSPVPLFRALLRALVAELRTSGGGAKEKAVAGEREEKDGRPRDEREREPRGERRPPGGGGAGDRERRDAGDRRHVDRRDADNRDRRGQDAREPPRADDRDRREGRGPGPERSRPDYEGRRGAAREGRSRSRGRGRG